MIILVIVTYIHYFHELETEPWPSTWRQSAHPTLTCHAAISLAEHCLCLVLFPPPNHLCENFLFFFCHMYVLHTHVVATFHGTKLAFALSSPSCYCNPLKILYIGVLCRTPSSPHTVNHADKWVCEHTLPLVTFHTFAALLRSSCCSSILHTSKRKVFQLYFCRLLQ